MPRVVGRCVALRCVASRRRVGRCTVSYVGELTRMEDGSEAGLDGPSLTFKTATFTSLPPNSTFKTKIVASPKPV